LCRFQSCMERLQRVRRLFLQLCNFVILALVQRESRTVSRATVYQILWVRGFRAHTFFGAQIQSFQPVTAPFPGELPSASRAVRRRAPGARSAGRRWRWRSSVERDHRTASRRTARSTTPRPRGSGGRNRQATSEAACLRLVPIFDRYRCRRRIPVDFRISCDFNVLQQGKFSLRSISAARRGVMQATGRKSDYGARALSGSLEADLCTSLVCIFWNGERR
jgi:hypothetical protein